MYKYYNREEESEWASRTCAFSKLRVYGRCHRQHDVSSNYHDYNDLIIHKCVSPSERREVLGKQKIEETSRKSYL